MLTSGLLGAAAVDKYAEIQEEVVREHLSATASAAPPCDVRIVFRTMAADAAQRSFLGPHVTTPEIAAQLVQDIFLTTQGFLCFPVPWKWTRSGLSGAIAAQERLVSVVEGMVEPAREHVENGGSPRCVLEYFVQSVSARNAEEKTEGGEEKETAASDHEIALGVIDMLMAAQDATVSGLCFAIDVLEGCEGGRAAVEKVRPPGRKKGGEGRGEGTRGGNEGRAEIAAMVPAAWNAVSTLFLFWR